MVLPTPENTSKLTILRWLRWLAVPVGLLLIVSAIGDWADSPFDPPWFFRVRGGIEIVLGLLILLPFGRIGSNSPLLWKRLFFALLLLSVAFVFARVIGVMFEARAVEAAGGDMWVPAIADRVLIDDEEALVGALFLRSLWFARTFTLLLIRFGEELLQFFLVQAPVTIYIEFLDDDF